MSCQLSCTSDRSSERANFINNLQAWVSRPATEGERALVERCIALYDSRVNTELDLGNLELNSIPSIICDLTFLTKINLRANYISGLPPEMGSLTALRELRVSDNKLSIIPNAICNLTALTRLSLSDNDIEMQPPEIGKLTGIKQLYLSRNKLSSLSSAMGKHTALTVLDLSYNKLSVLPPEIGDLTALTWLELRNNSLLALPPEIGKLTDLRELFLSNNSLLALPLEIGKLTALRVLALSDNSLSALHPTIGKLTDLRELFLSNNSLSTLPPEIGNLNALTILVLSDNDIQELPRTIGNLTALTWLDLSLNGLSAVPREIGFLTALTKLYLTQNSLPSLPPEIGNLTVLRDLSLRHNNLSMLPPEIGNLTALTYLDLNDNCLLALPVTIVQLQRLETLTIENNPELHELPLALAGLRQLLTLAVDQRLFPQANAIMPATRALRNQQACQNLPDLLRLWVSYSSLDNVNLDFILGLEDSKKESIAEWLTRLAHTQEFALNQVPLARLAYEMLHDVESNQEFAEYYFNQAEANNDACGDRAAMAFNELYTMWRILTSESSAPLRDKLQLLVKFARTHTLRNTIESLIAAHEQQQGRPERESVEIFLHYEGELADELGLLTAIKSRKYDMGERSWIQLDQLKAAVENNYLDEVVKMDSLQSLIDEDEVFKNLLQSEDEERGVNLEAAEHGCSKEYLAAISEAQQQRNTSIKNWVLSHSRGFKRQRGCASQEISEEEAFA